MPIMGEGYITGLTHFVRYQKFAFLLYFVKVFAKKDALVLKNKMAEYTI